MTICPALCGITYLAYDPGRDIRQKGYRGAREFSKDPAGTV